MSNFRSVRWCLLCAMSALALAASITTAAASAAEGYGEIRRFLPSETSHLTEETRAFGVDQSENSVWLGDETTTGSEEYRIRKFSSTGSLEGTVSFKPSYAAAERNAGIEGIAVDQANERVYVLSVYTRSQTPAIDPAKRAAGTLYAFSTKPVGGKLVPASGTAAGGVVATAATLHAESETYGAALIEPAGITVDPANGDVLILGQVDSPHAVESQGQQHIKHMAIQAITKTGEAATRYVDPRSQSTIGAKREFDSPVVSASGTHIYLVENSGPAHENLVEVPANLSSTAPKAVFNIAGKTPDLTLTGQPKFQFTPDEEFTPEAGFGDGLTLAPEGSGGRLYASAAINVVEEEENPGAVELKYGESGAVSEEGWTAGVKGEKGTAGSCALGDIYAGSSAPGVAAGKEGDMFVLSYSSDEVIEFGPGGSGCPVASTGKAKELEFTEASAEAKKKTSIKAGEEVFVKNALENADVKKVEWNFGDGETETVVYPAGSQVVEAEHEFPKSTEGATLTVTAKVETDNLATPTLLLKGSIIVKKETVPNEAPEVSKSPEVAETVQEGESIAVVAEEGGTPKPTADWQVKTAGSSSWLPDTEDEAVTIGPDHILEILNAATSKSGNEYRVIFKSSLGESVPSGAEKITVLAPTLPKVEAQPHNTTVVAGEKATFTASASGTPEPTIQWEVSTDGGKTWALEETHGSDFNGKVLEVQNPTTANNGRQYRALFVNEKGEAVSSAATLTVEAAKAPPTKSPTTTTTTTTSSSSGAAAAGGTTSVLGTTTSGTPAGNGKPYATIASHTLSVSSSGALVVKVSCPAGETTCRGSVTLSVVHAVVTKGKHKKLLVILAAGAFTVAGGQSKALTLHLSSKARTMLTHAHVLYAHAVIVASDPTGAKHSTQLSVTLRPAKRTHR